MRTDRLRDSAALSLAGLALTAMANAEPTWSIAPPVVVGRAPDKAHPTLPAPMKTEEARVLDELARLSRSTIYVEGHAEGAGPRVPPRTAEQRFAAVLNAGNPEVNGGQMRHGLFYDGGVYWAPDPLTFVYFNIVNRLKD